MNEFLYKDFWLLIFKHLNEIDILNIGQTCKSAYRVLLSPDVRKRISNPFKPKYRLTAEQFECLKTMNKYTGLDVKVVVGDVGSGKTLVALAYALRKYEKEKILIIAPPANVGYWGEVLEKFIDKPVLSNYQSVPKFYKRDWYSHIDEYQLFLTSQINSENICKLFKDKGIDYMILIDECHKCSDFAAEMLYNGSYLQEVVGFTATPEGMGGLWGVPEDRIYLQSNQLRGSLPELRLFPHELTGLNHYQTAAIANKLINEKNINEYMQKQIFRVATYGVALEYYSYIMVGKKKFNIGPKGVYMMKECTDKTEELFLKICDSAKAMELLRLVLRLKKAGEKVVVFDETETYLPVLHLLFQRNNVQSYLFTGHYSPKERVNNIKKFQKNGDVILGTFNNLSEGHSLVPANHEVYLNWPMSKTKYNQAVGRIHRFPQRKTCYVHLLASCELEMFLFLTQMSRYDDEKPKTIVKMTEVQDFVQEFYLK